MKESNNLPQNSEATSRTHNLKAYLLLAMERSGSKAIDLENMILDIERNFTTFKDEDFKIALKNGGLGKYGRTYRFSTQEVGIWLIAYHKEKNRALEPHEALKLGVHTNF